MSVISKHELMQELQRFNQRKLSRGELVLLSYCIGNKLPLIPVDVENPRMHVLGHLGLIERIQYRLNEATYIEKEDLEFIKDNVARLLMWRTAVSSGNMSVFFNGEPDVVIDQMSGMTRYFDCGVLCSVGDVADRANWLTSVFNKVIDYEKGCMEKEPGGKDVSE